MRIALKYLCWSIVACLQACVDPISFETDIEDGQLVFYGEFSQLSQDHIFHISRASGLGTPPTPVSGACIEILDNTGSSAFYEEIEPGKYLLAPENIPGIPGRSYQVEIILADGKTYLSNPQVMPEPVAIENLYFEIGPRQVISDSGNPVNQTFIEVYIDTPLLKNSESSSHLRSTVEQVYSFVDESCGPFDGAEQCYFIDPVDESEVYLFENEGNAQDFLKKFKVRSRRLVPYDEFTARHYFNVTQHSISEQELNYWKKIDAVANQSGNLFDVQPAKVVGNIYQEGNQEALVLGYFGVNGQSILRTFTTPGSIKPNPVFDCSDQVFFREHQPECCFCTQKDAIRIARPDYWDEG